MIKKLTERFKINKELQTIKKHFRTAKRHKSFNELEKVKFELLDFQGKLVIEDKLSENLSFSIHNLFSEIDYVRLKFTPAVSSLWPPFI